MLIKALGFASLLTAVFAAPQFHQPIFTAVAPNTFIRPVQATPYTAQTPLVIGAQVPQLSLASVPSALTDVSPEQYVQRVPFQGLTRQFVKYTPQFTQIQPELRVTDRLINIGVPKPVFQEQFVTPVHTQFVEEHIPVAQPIAVPQPVPVPVRQPIEVQHKFSTPTFPVHAPMAFVNPTAFSVVQPTVQTAHIDGASHSVLKVPQPSGFQFTQGFPTQLGVAALPSTGFVGQTQPAFLAPQSAVTTENQVDLSTFAAQFAGLQNVQFVPQLTAQVPVTNEDPNIIVA